MTEQHLPDDIFPSLPSDGRWRLLGELKERQGLDGEWRPIEVRSEEIPPTTPWVFNGGERRITLTFDSRLPYRSLVAALSQIWPQLTERGWITRTRELNDLSLALVRHICLEYPHASWQERLDAWNALFPEWSFKDRRALISRLHRAEESLTGTRDGLKNFYATAGADLNRSTLAGGPDHLVKAIERMAEDRQLGESNA